MRKRNRFEYIVKNCDGTIIYSGNVVDVANNFAIKELIEKYAKQEERIKELEHICTKNNKTLDKYCETNAKLKNKLDKIYELCKKNDYYLDFESETLREIFKEKK